MSSYETFYRQNYRQVLAMAIAFTRDRAAAEDLAQDVFLTAHSRWDSVSQYDQPAAWVRRVLINRATSRARRIGSEIRALARLGEPKPQQPDLSPETHEVWVEVARLPKRQQQVIVLHYVGDLSVSEIADAMACSKGAVKTHLHRARERLRPSLSDWDEE